MIRAIPVMFILIGCSAPGGVDWAEELLTHTNVRENLRSALASCAEFSQDLVGEEYKLDQQTGRLGLAPDDPAWLELAEIYDEFYAQACSSVDVEEIATLFADEYRSRFSDAELQEIVSFYKSDVGSEYIAVNAEISAEMNQRFNTKMAEGTLAARTVFQEKLQAFWLKYGKSPDVEPGERQP